jgi:hypothetical protein
MNGAIAGTIEGTTALMAAMERIIQADVGRNTGPLFAAAAGGLAAAATAIARQEHPCLGMITGFFIPGATPPAAETDGPPGVALLAAGLSELGIPCRLATDRACAAACTAALGAAGLGTLPIDAMAPGAPLAPLAASWRRAGVNLALAVERCGPARDGIPRTMRGLPLDACAAPLEQLFLAGPWRRIAIGDGGNEIGMGSLPHALIARHVANGAAIACTVPADHLVVAGVSNWGCYALLAALAALRPDWRAPLLAWLDPAREQAVIEAMVREGPAVDGVTGRPALSVDGLPMEIHHRRIRELRALVPEMTASTSFF